MKKQKLNLKSLEVKSFNTSASKGGISVETLGPLLCTVWCGTGETCPECAYTIPPQFGCDSP